MLHVAIRAVARKHDPCAYSFIEAWMQAGADPRQGLGKAVYNFAAMLSRQSGSVLPLTWRNVTQYLLLQHP